MSGDKQFCRSCGEKIKKAAEICPNCGVRNESATATNTGRQSGPVKRAHDPSNYETTVSDTWFYAVAGGIGAWVVLILLSGVVPPSSPVSTLAGFIGLIGWIIMPVGIYFDSRYVRANSKWDPTGVGWLIAAAVPFVNIVVGGAYLYRRNEVIGLGLDARTETPL